MINTYKKYTANVFVASCPEQHDKGDVIILTTRRGDEHECIVHNYLGEYKGEHLYSITRADGFNDQERARKKSEKYSSWADSRERKGNDLWEQSNEGSEFLRLGEPIKVGHHSEKRHRALIERNHNRMDRAMENYKKGEEHQKKAGRWEGKINEVNLSMPESLDYYREKLVSAIDYHEGLKSGKYEKPHSMAVQYANRQKKEIEKKLKIAEKLWG